MSLPERYHGKLSAVLMQIHMDRTGFYAGILCKERPQPEAIRGTLVEYTIYEEINGDFVAILANAAIKLTIGELQIGDLERFLTK